MGKGSLRGLTACQGPASVAFRSDWKAGSHEALRNSARLDDRNCLHSANFVHSADELEQAPLPDAGPATSSAPRLRARAPWPFPNRDSLGAPDSRISER